MYKKRWIYVGLVVALVASGAACNLAGSSDGDGHGAYDGAPDGAGDRAGDVDNAEAVGATIGNIIETVNLCTPADCTSSNGTGIYMAEGGHAGIGPNGLLITHFVSGALPHGTTGVTFEGMYLDPVSHQLRDLPVPGVVERAVYAGQELAVASVAEQGTMPTWQLTPLGGTGSTVVVTGDRLLRLALHIKFVTRPVDGPQQVERYVLDFDRHTTEPGANTVHAYNMRWRVPGGSIPNQYCFGPTDPVVFQQGIHVDAVTGKVTRVGAAASVTISCRGGGPATVYRWGYDYQTDADLFHFASAVQMKRAAYCGDDRAYTEAGTPITMSDSDGIHTEAPDTLAQIEAMWSGSGATCINLWNLRHPELHFTGTCHGLPLPVCASLPSNPSEPFGGGPYLVNASVGDPLE
jgi:ADYC domain